jgi:uncharacterized membrane protein
MIIRVTMVVLCGIGLYASAFMARKAARAARGELTEPSVVQTSRGRTAGGIANAQIGLFYYCGILACVPFLHVNYVLWAAGAAACLAAAFSLYLAYSLLFVTRMPCVYCWTGHAVNWTLSLLLIFAARW